MKPGDLVRCMFQPKAAGVDPKTNCCIEMKYEIKDELGIYMKHRDNYSGTVLFPQFGYEHVLALRSLEVVSEGG